MPTQEASYIDIMKVTIRDAFCVGMTNYIVWLVFLIINDNRGLLLAAERNDRNNLPDLPRLPGSIQKILVILLK
jgi:hypothetical protein